MIWKLKLLAACARALGITFNYSGRFVSDDLELKGRGRTLWRSPEVSEAVDHWYNHAGNKHGQGTHHFVIEAIVKQADTQAAQAGLAPIAREENSTSGDPRQIEAFPTDHAFAAALAAADAAAARLDSQDERPVPEGTAVAPSIRSESSAQRHGAADEAGAAGADDRAGHQNHESDLTESILGSLTTKEARAP